MWSSYITFWVWIVRPSQVRVISLWPRSSVSSNTEMLTWGPSVKESGTDSETRDSVGTYSAGEIQVSQAWPRWEVREEGPIPWENRSLRIVGMGGIRAQRGSGPYHESSACLLLVSLKVSCSVTFNKEPLRSGVLCVFEGTVGSPWSSPSSLQPSVWCRWCP